MARLRLNDRESGAVRPATKPRVKALAALRLRRNDALNILPNHAGRRRDVEIGESHLGNYLVLRPVGRLDNGTSADFQAHMVKALNAAGRDIIVDFSGINYVSSAGLQALMTASRLKPAGRASLSRRRSRWFRRF